MILNNSLKKIIQRASKSEKYLTYFHHDPEHADPSQNCCLNIRSKRLFQNFRQRHSYSSRTDNQLKTKLNVYSEKIYLFEKYLTRTFLCARTSLKLFFKCCRTILVAIRSLTLIQTLNQRIFLFIITKLIVFIRSLIFARFCNFIQRITVERFARTSS